MADRKERTAKGEDVDLLPIVTAVRKGTAQLRRRVQAANRRVVQICKALRLISIEVARAAPEVVGRSAAYRQAKVAQLELP